MNHIDHAILRVARRATAAQPTSLADLIAGVDAIERMVLTYAELDGALRRLIADGALAESAPLRFYRPASPPAVRAFSGLSGEAHAEAVAEYRRAFDRAAAEPDDEEDDTRGPLVVVRWVAADGRRISQDDEHRVDELGDRIEAALPDVAGAEVIGYEQGERDIEILVWGEGTDEEVDQVVEAVSRVAAAFGLPPGSEVTRVLP
jgi:hypothetical protein